jgi:hypothetical protein
LSLGIKGNPGCSREIVINFLRTFLKQKIMKAKKFVIAVLFVLGLISASLSSTIGSANNDYHNAQWEEEDSTDSNGGGGPIPPIGH